MDGDLKFLRKYSNHGWIVDPIFVKGMDTSKFEKVTVVEDKNSYTIYPGWKMPPYPPCPDPDDDGEDGELIPPEEPV